MWRDLTKQHTANAGHHAEDDDRVLEGASLGSQHHAGQLQTRCQEHVAQLEPVERVPEEPDDIQAQSIEKLLL